MPRRTNDFQRLVAHIHQTLASSSAKIEESALVEVDGLPMREVDILLEDSIANYRIKVAIEVADDSRPFSLDDLESYLSKYRGECRVQVDKFVVVTRRGFTSGATQKALKADVELLTLAQAEGKDWANLKPEKFDLKVEPYACAIIFTPTISVNDGLSFRTNGRLFCPHGHDHGTLEKLARDAIRLTLTTQQEVFKQAQQYSISSGGKPCHVDVGYERSGWKLKYFDSFYELEKITVRIHVARGSSVINCTDYILDSSKGGERRVRQLETSVGGKKISWIMTGEQPQEKIILRIDPIKSDEGEDAGNRKCRKKPNKKIGEGRRKRR